MKKIKFREYLREYRKAPLGTEYSLLSLRNHLRDEENIEILPTSIPGENKDFIIYQYKFGPEDLLFILVNRIDLDDVVGYCFIHKVSKDLWQSKDSTIFSKYRNKGYGTILYAKLIDFGFTLINGFSLSDAMEVVWKDKLPKIVNVKVINLQTMDVEEFSDKPTKDTAFPDEKQIWFYIASTHLKSVYEAIENNRGNDENLGFERWLSGDELNFSYGFRSTNYGITEGF